MNAPEIPESRSGGQLPDKAGTSEFQPPATQGVPANLLKKRCPNCKKLFGPRKLADGRTEYPGIFKKKIHCSQICGAIAAQARKRAEKSA